MPSSFASFDSLLRSPCFTSFELRGNYLFANFNFPVNLLSFFFSLSLFFVVIEYFCFFNRRTYRALGLSLYVKLSNCLEKREFVSPLSVYIFKVFVNTRVRLEIRRHKMYACTPVCLCLFRLRTRGRTRHCRRRRERIIEEA